VINRNLASVLNRLTDRGRPGLAVLALAIVCVCTASGVWAFAIHLLDVVAAFAR